MFARSAPTDELMTDDRWGAIVHEWLPKLCRYFRRMPGSAEGRVELAMEVCADAVADYIAGVSGDLPSIIAVNARSVARRQKRIQRHEYAMDVSNEWVFAAAAGEPERSQRREALALVLDEMLRSLPENQRLAIERRLDGVSDAELGREIGCTTATVRTLRYRGLRSLRAQFRESPPPPNIREHLLELCGITEGLR